MSIVGGIAINRQAGGINPYAVESAAKLGARILWFPTMDALSYQSIHREKKEDNDLSSYISVLDEKGKLKSNVYDVLDVVNKYNMIICTGHLSAQEGIEIVKAAKHKGVKKIVLTHANNINTHYNIDQKIECISMGAIVEYSYFTVARGYKTISQIKQQIDKIGYENILLTSDLGQPNLKFPDEGFRDYLEMLLEIGVNEYAISYMVKVNPAKLLGDLP